MAPKLRKVAASAHAALAELKPGDRAAVMIFWRKTELVEPFTGDLAAIEAAINDRVLSRTRGGTHILGAINEAADYIRHQPRSDHRRAIVIVTDNHGQFSGKKNTAVSNLWEADAVLCGLQVRFAGETALLVARRINPSPAGMAMAWFMDGENMTGVAEKTGGDLLKGDDAGAQFTELMHRLRMRYSLYYAMPKGKAGEERRIKVQLSNETQAKNPQSRVLARSGYHLPSS
jgi:VWFA-related protein